MPSLYENSEKLQRALLVGVDTGDFDCESSMKELYELVKSAGAEPVASMVQKRDKPDSATCIGSGRLEEITDFCAGNEIDFIVFDTELTPTQIRNIEAATDVRTIDRTMLILDIFAIRARSNEGKLQVELAQLRYLLPRLSGKGKEMSRLGGGVGTRGPGETKLETDKRHIRRRIEYLKEQLAEMTDRRERHRERRRKDGIITVAIVGYTNAGKSTLMNTLTQAGVLSEDKLFATLDPTSRALKLPCGISVMMIDTVGLVRRLPHHLVEAFKSTLEEAADADIILNVCDASSEEYRLHLDVTCTLLRELGCTDRPIISVFNKCDLVDNMDDLPRDRDSVHICAKSGRGIDELLAAVENNLPVKLKRFRLLVPFDKAALLSVLRSAGALQSEEYTADGIAAQALVEEPLWHKVEPYEVRSE
ncbi:MAG: GTPase HflX [Clostridia bacterium]|nr:GTPase HflX [Clostridia bacterium]